MSRGSTLRYRTDPPPSRELRSVQGNPVPRVPWIGQAPRGRPGRGLCPPRAGRASPGVFPRAMTSGSSRRLRPVARHPCPIRRNSHFSSFSKYSGGPGARPPATAAARLEPSGEGALAPKALRRGHLEDARKRWAQPSLDKLAPHVTYAPRRPSSSPHFATALLPPASAVTPSSAGVLSGGGIGPGCRTGRGIGGSHGEVGKQAVKLCQQSSSHARVAVAVEPVAHPGGIEDSRAVELAPDLGVEPPVCVAHGRQRVEGMAARRAPSASDLPVKAMMRAQTRVVGARGSRPSEAAFGPVATTMWSAVTCVPSDSIRVVPYRVIAA